MTRRPPKYSYERDRYSSPEPPSSKKSPVFGLNYLTVAVIAGIFVIGIGVGMAFSTVQSTNPTNVFSREAIDRSAPNPELCAQYGASAIVTDMRVFVTLNPFNVYVTQPEMQPGCVLRRNNWSLLERQSKINSDQVRDCKQRMNTFGFVGPLEGKPEVDCVYQNDAAGNLFLQPGANGSRPETDNF